MRLFIYLFTNSTEETTEEDGKEDECCVPVMLIVDRVDPEENENDGFGRAAQHFHSIFNCRV